MIELTEYKELTKNMLIKRILNINILSCPVYKGIYRCKSIVYIAVHLQTLFRLRIQELNKNFIEFSLSTWIRSRIKH